MTCAMYKSLDTRGGRLGVGGGVGWGDTEASGSEN